EPAGDERLVSAAVPLQERRGRVFFSNEAEFMVGLAFSWFYPKPPPSSLLFGVGGVGEIQFILFLPLLRALLASAAIAAQMTLAGCGGGTPVTSGRHMQPLSQRMLATLKAKNMDKESPILMRIFKEEAELEVWKQDDSGRFALLRTYP